MRWPELTRTTDGPLQSATRIPEGTELLVVDTDPEAQLATADRVTAAAVSRLTETLSTPLAGAQTYDKVALDHDDVRAYHNTTTSLLVFPE